MCPYLEKCGNPEIVGLSFVEVIASHMPLYNDARPAEPQLQLLIVSIFSNSGRYIVCKW
jgi:hypothetical protein